MQAFVCLRCSHSHSTYVVTTIDLCSTLLLHSLLIDCHSVGDFNVEPVTGGDKACSGRTWYHVIITNHFLRYKTKLRVMYYRCTLYGD